MGEEWGSALFSWISFLPRWTSLAIPGYFLPVYKPQWKEHFSFCRTQMKILGLAVIGPVWPILEPITVPDEVLLWLDSSGSCAHPWTNHTAWGKCCFHWPGLNHVLSQMWGLMGRNNPIQTPMVWAVKKRCFPKGKLEDWILDRWKKVMPFTAPCPLTLSSLFLAGTGCLGHGCDTVLLCVWPGKVGCPVSWVLWVAPLE